MNKQNVLSHIDTDFEDILQAPQVVRHLLHDAGFYPKNAEAGVKLPLLVYQGALALPEENPPSVIEALLEANHWGGAWRDGIYSFHHYHSTAHEVLGVYRGTAKVQLGGEEGVVLSIESGDVIVIPAGVAHKNLGASADFRVVGAYPAGQSPDMQRGYRSSRGDSGVGSRIYQNIANVPLPHADPLYGEQGPLMKYWAVSTKS
jgi:uncharacterized protein YjlB